jgi:hypothetical protein
VVHVGVVEDDDGVLAAEFEDCGLDMASRERADDPADAGGSGEVDDAYARVGDQGLGDVGGVLSSSAWSASPASGRARCCAA